MAVTSPCFLSTRTTGWTLAAVRAILLTIPTHPHQQAAYFLIVTATDTPQKMSFSSEIPPEPA